MDHSFFLQEQLQINLLQQTHLTAIPPSAGSTTSSTSSKANKLSLSNLQQQQQQIMAQMQITQQALMLGQNIDGEDQSFNIRGKEGHGLLSESGYPIGTSFGSSSRKSSTHRQVCIE